LLAGDAIPPTGVRPQAGSDIDPIAKDSIFLLDHISNIQTYSQQHFVAAIRLVQSTGRLLNFERAGCGFDDAGNPASKPSPAAQRPLPPRCSISLSIVVRNSDSRRSVSASSNSMVELSHNVGGHYGCQLPLNVLPLVVSHLSPEQTCYLDGAGPTEMTTPPFALMSFEKIVGHRSKHLRGFFVRWRLGVSKLSDIVGRWPKGWRILSHCCEPTVGKMRMLPVACDTLLSIHFRSMDAGSKRAAGQLLESKAGASRLSDQV
jgi:hypothetical protein